MLSIFPLRTSDPARYYIEAVSLGAEEYYLSRARCPAAGWGAAPRRSAWREPSMLTTCDPCSPAGGPTAATCATAGCSAPATTPPSPPPSRCRSCTPWATATTSGRWSPPTTRRWQEPSGTWSATHVACAAEGFTVGGSDSRPAAGWWRPPSSTTPAEPGTPSCTPTS